MSNKVDKFFKEKLEGHTLPPSAQAWEKLEGHLSKKNRGFVVWVRIAAGVALIALVSVALVLFVGRRHDSTNLAKKESTPVSDSVAADKAKDEALSPSVSPAPVAVNEVAQSQPKRKKDSIVPTKVNIETTPVVEDQAPDAQVVAIAETVNAETAQEQPEKVVAQKSIVLVYSLPAKKPAVTSEPVVAVEQKKTGIERVLEIARDVKNSDSPIADLREAKDDILALDFRKDKNKNSKQSNLN